MKPTVSVFVCAQNRSTKSFGVATPAAVARRPNTNADRTGFIARS
jgi:hypothetical protein